MKKYLYLLFLFICTERNTFAAEKAAADGDTSTSPSDTIALKINNTAGLNKQDSLLLFPAYGLYCQWDTMDIHPYHYELSKINDTTLISLIDEENCGFMSPAKGNITSDFGARKRRPHYGVDIDLETGDTVGAAFAGMVRIAKKNKSYGNVVIIRHSNGLETYYAHLSKICVESGQYVEPGQLIGLGGNTGHSFGSHLHFEIRYKGHPINPHELISFDEMKLVSDNYLLTKKTFEFVTKEKSAKYYIIKKGDTLYKIAKRYSTTPQKLCKLNGIKTTTTLRPGKKLRCI